MKSIQLSAAIAALVVLGGACSSGSGAVKGAGGGSGQGAGGTSGLGGTVGSGGVAGSGGATGGQAGSGGADGTGGRVGSGGTSGGTSGTGGRTGAGGATGGQAGSGGVAGTGGRVGSGGTSGGTSATGGGTGLGGTSVGAGGTVNRDAGRDVPAGTGGRLGTGGAVALDGGPTSTGGGGGVSAGCGAGKTTSDCGKSGTKCSLTVNSKTREYYLQLPTSYDKSKPYPVVFQLHPMTGTAEMALTMYKISTGMPDAIYITPQGLKKFEQFMGSEVTGWANTDGEDIQFMLDMLYCVDSARVFSTGFSYGGMMSYAIGCELGGTFRAIAPMAGATISGCKLSGKPVAMWGAHGTHDSVVDISQGRQARDKILKQNGCGTTTVPVEAPNPCVAYQGCTEGYPVTWCEWDGDHATPSFSGASIAAFFKQF